MNEKKLLRIVADLILEYLEDDKKEAPAPVEVGELAVTPEIRSVPQVEALEESPAEASPLDTGEAELAQKNQEIERLKEERSKAQMNAFNFQPIGGTNG
jgi:hypothetical protein